MAHSTFHLLPASLTQGRETSAPESSLFAFSSKLWGSHCLPLLSCLFVCLFLSSFGHIHTCILPRACQAVHAPNWVQSLSIKSFLCPVFLYPWMVLPCIQSLNLETPLNSLSLLKILFAIHHYILRILSCSLQPQFSQTSPTYSSEFRSHYFSLRTYSLFLYICNLTYGTHLCHVISSFHTFTCAISLV